MFMPREYNFIYEKLVEGKNDIIGHIAYSIYKEEKINYVKKKAEGTGEVTDEILKSFHEISSSRSSLESYRIKAEIFMQAFFDNTFQEMKEDLEIQATENQSNILEDIIAPLTSGFWKNVLAGLLSAFIFAFLLAGLAFIIQFSGSTISVNIEKNKTEQIE